MCCLTTSDPLLDMADKAGLVEVETGMAPVVEPAALAALPQFAQRGKFEGDAALALARYPVPMAGVAPGGLGGAPRLDSARG